MTDVEKVSVKLVSAPDESLVPRLSSNSLLSKDAVNSNDTYKVGGGGAFKF